MPRIRALLGAVLLAFAWLPVPSAYAQHDSGWFCGSLETGYGPFDYRSTPVKKREIVERYHFTTNVKTLTAGQSSTNIAADIAYTLHAFPNHPEALDAMARLGRKEGTTKPAGAKYTVECYFERALRFTSDDPQVRILYAHFLAVNKRRDEATKQLEAAVRAEPSSPYILYNLGLVYADVGDYDKSLSYAHKAYASGIELPGLRERLRNAGKWREPAR